MAYCWLMFLVLGAHAYGACEARRLADLQPVFADVSEALAAAQTRFSWESARLDVEFVGGIVRTPAGLLVSAYRGCSGRDEFRLRMADTERLVALWHTHGAPGRLRSYFSETDGELVRRLGKPLYLLSGVHAAKVLRPQDVVAPAARLSLRGALRQRVVGYTGSPVHGGATSR